MSIMCKFLSEKHSNTIICYKKICFSCCISKSLGYSKSNLSYCCHRSMSSWICVTQNHVVTTSNHFIIMNYNSTKRASIFAILPLYMLLEQIFIKNTPNYSLKLQPEPISLISPTWLAFMHILVELTKKMIYLTTRALLDELNHMPNKGKM